MITGISGGAVIPLLMGVFSDLMGSQSGALLTLIACVIYLIVIVYPLVKKSILVKTEVD